MKRENPLFYWDSCIFLAWLKNEERKPGEMTGIKELVSQINKNAARLVTSQMTRAEILKSTLTVDAINKLDNVFKRKNIILAPTDGRVWQLAYEIRDYYQARKDADGLPTVTLPDAVHLATAILYQADVFFTFDETDKPNRRRALIPLSGNVAGKYNLIIQKPMGLQTDIFNSI